MRSYTYNLRSPLRPLAFALSLALLPSAPTLLGMEGSGMMIASRNGMVVSKPLPYDAEVEYLESTGTQYINISDAHDFRESMFVLRAMQTASNGESAILGSQEHSRFELYLLIEKIRFWSGNGLWTPDTVSFPINQIGDVTLSINGSSATVTFSGQTSTASGTSLITGVEHLQIFAYRTAYPFTGRIYFAKVYVSSALTLDLIPVRFTNELGQSEGAMYDRVSGQLFRNAGTGAFVFPTA